MTNGAQHADDITFKVDKAHLYREETITDLKLASIKKLTPILADGSEDNTRETIFLGASQLTTPQGVIPIQSRLKAKSLDQAMDIFPAAMEIKVQQVLKHFQQLKEQQENLK
ncbi:MAG: cytoplasmic protein [Desulfobacteraceae bacterium]|nr:cytoplasmic protein [Desulfobacteraceae bacterium]